MLEGDFDESGRALKIYMDQQRLRFCLASLFFFLFFFFFVVVGVWFFCSYWSLGSSFSSPPFFFVFDLCFCLVRVLGF